MAYKVKEIFYTLQGEGINTGRPAVFCRFSGCNLWSGKESDRRIAACRFCDTDFAGTDGPGGGNFDEARSLAEAIDAAYGGTRQDAVPPLVALTGGEPALQIDTALIDALHARNFEIAIETNGTLLLPQGIDWITVSPKAGTHLAVTSGDELKLVFPQEGIKPADLEDLSFRHFLLQPQDGPKIKENTATTVQYCLSHPKWRLSLQTHKILGIK
jgi:7-carboxy-7-deazaguanine synthase